MLGELIKISIFTTDTPKHIIPETNCTVGNSQENEIHLPQLYSNQSKTYNIFHLGVCLVYARKKLTKKHYDGSYSLHSSIGCSLTQEVDLNGWVVGTHLGLGRGLGLGLG